MKRLSSLSLFCSVLLVLSSCTAIRALDKSLVQPADLAEKTPSQKMLESLPAASNPIVLSVYDFQDYTGQNKSNDNLAEFSRAVTQGGAPILYKALQDAGKGKWFTIIERAGLKNLLQERQLIRAMREQYTLPDGSQLPDVAPMLYAGVILEGGIVAYETNVLTGGIGASYLGLTGATQYRRDMVTIYLRAVSVQNGEVLLNVNTTKTIYSTAVNASVFRYVALNEILETETGFSINEPPQLAVRQAIEYGVYAMVMEGIEKGLWSFADGSAAKDMLRDYMKRRDGSAPNEQTLNRMLDIQPTLPPKPVAAQPMPVAAPPSVANRSVLPPPPAPVARLPIGTPPPGFPTAANIAPAQPPEGTRYVPPPAGIQDAEIRTYEPPVERDASYYDVVCSAQGCFPVGHQ